MLPIQREAKEGERERERASATRLEKVSSQSFFFSSSSSFCLFFFPSYSELLQAYPSLLETLSPSTTGRLLALFFFSFFFFLFALFSMRVAFTELFHCQQSRKTTVLQTNERGRHTHTHSI